jgi:hypothetical protein
MPREKYDTEILDEAMNNAYDIVTGVKTFDHIMEHSDECALPFDIRSEQPDLEGMIEYFIETEEYEKCAVLKQLLTKNNKHE